MSYITLTNTLVNGTVIDADNLNENFNDIVNIVNGSIDGTNMGGTLNIDTIAEKTADAGVTVDGVLIKDNLSVSGITPIDGWIAAGETWTYASADAPTYTITVPTDATTKYSAGMRIKLTHGGSVKYFNITKVAATVLTLYGGTDYTLADTAITLPFYSVVKAPFGFPLSPAKWTVIVTDETTRSQATPTQNTWYNLGSVNIVIPIGLWRVTYIVSIANSTVAKEVYVTLSTANNSESDSNNSAGFNARTAEERNIIFKEIPLSLASKTTYYINTRSTSASSGTIYNLNVETKLIIRAVCAYL